MKFCDEDLNRIEEYASALLSPEEISILMDMDVEDRNAFEEYVKNHVESLVYDAYHKGRLKTKYELRKIVIKLAKNGSPAAQPIADKYLSEQKL